MGGQEDGGSHLQKEVSVVTLIIKCPTNPSDFTIQMPVEATVLAVKQRLQRDYAGNPDPDRQRLIVAGVVLNEAVSIQDVFKQKNLEEPQVMHLSVLPLPSAATPSRSTAGASSASGSSSAAQQATVTSEPSASSFSEPSASLPYAPVPHPTDPTAGSSQSPEEAQHLNPSVAAPAGTSGEQVHEAGSVSEAGPSQSSTMEAGAEAARGGTGTGQEGAPAMNPDTFNQAVLQMMYGGGVLPLAFNPALAAFNAAALLNPAAILPLLYPGFFPAMYPAAYYPVAPPGDPQAQNQPFPPPQQPGLAPQTQAQTPGGGENLPQGHFPPPPPFGMGPGGPVGLPGDPYGMLPMPFNFPFGAPFPMMAAGVHPGGPMGMAAPPPNGAQAWHGQPPGGAPVQGQPRPDAEALGLRQRHPPPAANGQPDLANGAAGARAAPGARRQVVWHFRLQFRLDLMLIVKLAIVVFVFNQDGSPDRLLFFITMAVLVYLYQTGALAPVVRWIRANTERALRPVQLHPQPAVAQPQGAPLEAGAVDAQMPRPNDAQGMPPEHVAGENQAPRAAGGVAAGANRVPGWGILREISMFVLGFVTSLLPGFQGGDDPIVAPQAPPVARAPAQPAAAQDRPHQD